MVKKTQAVRQAEELLASSREGSEEKLEELVFQLLEEGRCDLAAQLIARFAPPDSPLQLRRIVCVLKDGTLSSSARLDQAEKLLAGLNAGLKQSAKGDVDAFERLIETRRAVGRAQTLLAASSAPIEELEALAKKLKGRDQFEYARRLFGRAAEVLGDDDRKQRRWLRQQQAICTYKNPDRPQAERYDEALEILAMASEEPLSATTDPETLGLAGAITKRKWESGGQRKDLLASLDFYARGHERDVALAPDLETDGPVQLDPDHKKGYPGINAAFVLDQLNVVDEAGGATETAVRKVRQDEAKRIRTHLVQYLSRLIERGSDVDSGKAIDWWVYVTLAEAQFGLIDYPAAAATLREGKAQTSVDPWQLRSTAKQLVRLASLQGVDLAETLAARDALLELVNEDQYHSILRGKIGIGLSGGGFRASLYHLGVLARLAELGILRHVEVLSCVSGGAIVGAHYYLELRRRLQKQPEGEIDYCDLVDHVAETFLKGVQQNVRMSVVGSCRANLKTVVSAEVSRTTAAGHFYERYLFGPLFPENRDRPFTFRHLTIEPKGAPITFHPRRDNWERSEQVPELVINATTLNTGNNWQFTASWMGEPPPQLDEEIAGRTRLRRLYYTQAPNELQDLALSAAVGSSSCVPGLLEPVAMLDLYDGLRVVRLVDGGVHDNQGIGSLLEQECDVLILSDASGQLDISERAGGGILAALGRTLSISMARAREGELQSLRWREQAGIVKSRMLVHLKLGLDSSTRGWVGCGDPEAPADEASASSMTEYGVDKEIQLLLAGLRTDLDSFSDTEADALMASGYLMTRHHAPHALEAVLPHVNPAAAEHRWPFLAVAKSMQVASTSDDDARSQTRRERLLRILSVGSAGSLKPLYLSPVRTVISLLCVLAVVAIPVVFIQLPWEQSWGKVIGWGVTAWLSLIALGAVVKAGHYAWVFRDLRPAQLFQAAVQGALAVSFATAGKVVATLNRFVLEPIYLAYGSRKHFSDPGDPT